MKRVTGLLIILLFVVAPFSSFNPVEAASINLVEDMAGEAIDCAKEYEAGNMNILQLRACLHHAREGINDVLSSKGLTVQNKDHGTGVTASAVKKVLGSANDETRHGWDICEERETSFDEKVSWWEKSIFSGDKVIISLNAWPHVNCEDEVFYWMDFNIKIKAPKPDISQCKSNVKSMAQQVISGSGNGNDLMSEIVGCEAMASMWLEQYSTDCDDAISNYFSSSERVEDQKMERWEVLLDEGDYERTFLILQTCKSCEWPWVNVRVEAHMHQPEDFEQQKKDRDVYRGLEKTELESKFKHALSEAVHAAKDIKNVDFKLLAESNSEMDVILQAYFEKMYWGKEPPLDAEHDEILNFLENQIDTYGSIEKQDVVEKRWEDPMIEDTFIREEAWCQDLERIECASDESCANGECVPNIVGEDKCDDKEDNDGDGAIDGADRDCSGGGFSPCQQYCDGCWSERDSNCRDMCESSGCYDCQHEGDNCHNVCQECWECHSSIQCSDECYNCEADRDCKHECGGDTSSCYTECMENRGRVSSSEECKQKCVDLNAGSRCTQMCQEGVFFVCSDGTKQKVPCDENIDYLCDGKYLPIPCTVFECDDGTKQTAPCTDLIICTEGYYYNKELESCVASEIVKENCDDGIDNDDDFRIDCDDTECWENSICTEAPVPGDNVCGDGVCEGDENSFNCLGDCEAECGNALCEPGEDSTGCPDDCDPTVSDKKDYGETCSDDDECIHNKCRLGKCSYGNGAGEGCDENWQCESEVCEDGECAGGGPGSQFCGNGYCDEHECEDCEYPCPEDCEESGPEPEPGVGPNDVCNDVEDCPEGYICVGLDVKVCEEKPEECPIGAWCVSLSENDFKIFDKECEIPEYGEIVNMEHCEEEVPDCNAIDCMQYTCEDNALYTNWCNPEIGSCEAEDLVKECSDNEECDAYEGACLEKRPNGGPVCMLHCPEGEHLIEPCECVPDEIIEDNVEELEKNLGVPEEKDQEETFAPHQPEKEQEQQEADIQEQEPDNADGGSITGNVISWLIRPLLPSANAEEINKKEKSLLSWLTGWAVADDEEKNKEEDKEKNKEENDWDCTKEEGSCWGAHQYCDEESGHCRCEEGWNECNGDWIDGCESQEMDCYKDGCNSEQCAPSRCAEGQPAIVDFGCYVGGSHEENRNMLIMTGTCRTENGRTQPHMHFDIWGESFDEIQQMRHGKNNAWSEKWCEYELQGLKEQRKEIESSLNTEFMDWFFNDYVRSNPAEWDRNLGALWDVYWFTTDVNRRIAEMNEKCSSEGIDMEPINLEYESDFGKVKIYEEWVTADFGKMGMEEDIGKVQALAPYMEIWIFPPEDVLIKEFEKAQAEKRLMGDPKDHKTELSAKDIQEIKQDEEIMKVVHQIINEKDNSRVIATIHDGDREVYRVLAVFSKDNVVQVQPGVEKQDADIRIDIEYSFLYNVIKTSEEDMRGTEVMSPDWAPSKGGFKIKDIVDEVKMIAMFLTSGDNFKTEGIGKMEGVQVLRLLMEGD